MPKCSSIGKGIAVIAGLVCLAGANAGESGAYISASGGYVSPGNDQQTVDNILISGGAVGFSSTISTAGLARLAAGYKLNKNVAVEVTAFASGNENYTASGGNLLGSVDATASFSGEALSVVGILPLGTDVALTGRVGVASAKLKISASTAFTYAEANATKTAATYGVGVRYDTAGNVFFLVDVDSYELGDSYANSRVTSATVGVGYQF